MQLLGLVLVTLLWFFAESYRGFAIDMCEKGDRLLRKRATLSILSASQRITKARIIAYSLN